MDDGMGDPLVFNRLGNGNNPPYIGFEQTINRLPEKSSTRAVVIGRVDAFIFELEGHTNAMQLSQECNWYDRSVSV
jgi:hypothetical protein